MGDGGKGQAREPARGQVEFIFLTYCSHFESSFSILFYQCNNKNIIYRQFLLFTLYILHIHSSY